jgi:hypothetical protein
VLDAKREIKKAETLKEQDKMTTKLIFMENEAVHVTYRQIFHCTLPNKTQLDIITKKYCQFLCFLALTQLD